MKISVVIPCYNQGRFLADAVNSLLAQTHSDLQIIVVDDGSTDDTQQVARTFGSRLQLIVQKNGGLSAARNTGLHAAIGDMLLFLDSDDWLDPDCIERLVAVVNANPGVVVVHGSCRFVNPEKVTIKSQVARSLGPDPFHRLLCGNAFPVHTAMVRRDAALSAGDFDITLKSCEDWDFWLRIAAAGGKFVPVPDAWVVYRRHPQSMSTANQRMRDNGFKVLKKNSNVHKACFKCRLSIARAYKNILFNYYFR